MLLYYIYKSIINKLHSELLLFTKWVFVTLFTKRDLDTIPSFIKIPLLKTAIISRPRLKFLTRQTRLLSPFFRAEVAPSRLVRQGGGLAFQRRWQRHGWGPGGRGAKPSKLGANVGRTPSSCRGNTVYVRNERGELFSKGNVCIIRWRIVEIAWEL